MIYMRIQKRDLLPIFYPLTPERELKIMNRKDISGTTNTKGTSNGLTHLAISVGSIDKVDKLTELIRSSGFEIYGEPRTTGDGYYESVVLDPEGNHIEITN